MRRLVQRMVTVAVVAVSAVFVAGASGSAGSRQTEWVIRDLGTLGGKGSATVAINERGQVVGSSGTRGCKRDHAFLWENGKMRDLGSEWGESYAIAISENGQVIGGDDPVECDGHEYMSYDSFFWQGGKSVLIGNLSDVQAVNDRGQVVGIDKGSRDASQAFLWRGGKMTALDASPRASGADDINERGQVVGVSGANAVLWEGGKMQKLGILPGKKRSVALAVNESGQVIGSSYTRQEPPEWRTVLDGQAAYGARAFLWQDGRLHDLGTLSGTAFSSPVAIKIGRAHV